MLAYLKEQFEQQINVSTQHKKEPMHLHVLNKSALRPLTRSPEFLEFLEILLSHINGLRVLWAKIL